MTSQTITRITKTPLLTGDDPEAKRQEILKYFHETYDIDEALYEPLSDTETFHMRADPLRHPLIFYYGHTACFYINKLILAKLIDKRVNPSFESMFAVGVDEMSWDDLNEAHYDWPTPEEVKAYRDEVRAVVDHAIKTMPLSLPIGWDSPFWVIMMGIEHERIHLETSSVLIRQLPLEKLHKHPMWGVCDERGDDAPRNELLPVKAGSVTLGKPFGHPLYGWDNEYGQQTTQVQDFKASKFLVSNREFMGFVEAGGYTNRKYWTEEGWNWREYKQAEHPLFWVRDDGGAWKLRCMLEVIDMPWNWPVEVNYLEAKAFCNWKAAETGRPVRLPTEEEWYCLRRLIPEDQPDWEKAPGNINLEHWSSSCPVDRFEQAGGFHDIVGNVWQWTETPIFGFEGFQVHELYDDFSTPTFDGKHNLIKGGSWISTGNEATIDSRYAFRRHFFQHAGLRYIESEQPVQVREDIYETDGAVSQYCEFHYGDEHFGVPNFPKQCAEIALDLMEDKPRRKALDLGCATGRSTFELARGFDKVTGLDFSARFIRVGDEMVQKGYIKYELPDEGDLVSYHERRLDALGLEEVKDKVEFYQADACNLKPLYTGYDLVLACNLIDRLYSPRKFLKLIPTRINSGGLLVLTSPYTWLEEFTEREEWLGGYKVAGENLTTLDALHQALGDQFTPVGEPRDIEFVIRETRRKFQHTLAQMTVWQKK